jgi:tetratricopeptide (TPR) repeat protein
VAEVYLKLWEAEIMEQEMLDQKQRRRSSPSSLLYAQSREACANLHQYARVFPIGQPRAWLWQGVYEWLSGHSRKAQQAWRKSLAAAQRLAMPYEQGLAHYEIGRHATAKERCKHLAQACNIFAQVGATYDLLKAQGVLYGRAEEW